MRNTNIQLLRVIACLGVLSVHLGQRFLENFSLKIITDFGANCVYLFFLISGYLSFFSNKKVKVKDYYIGRMVKIFPVYYAVIIYNFLIHTFILHDIPYDQTHLGWLRYLLFLSRIIPSEENFWSNLSATWTMGCFVLFYLLVPFFKKIIKSLHSSIIVWIVFYLLSKIVHYYTDYFEPVNYLHYFLFGVLIYFLSQRKESVFSISLVALFLLLDTTRFRIELITVIFSLIFLQMLRINKQYKYEKIIRFIDEYSYTIYLGHAIAIENVDLLKQYSNAVYWKMVVFLIFWVELIVICFVLHNIIEKNVVKLYRRKTK